MKRLACLILSFGIAVAFLAATGNLTFAQFPDPKDEAKLYELAKKEGTVVEYASGPLDATKAIAKDFETKYPGIKVEILRVVGVAQYQRFLHETNAKQYIADILYMSDYPSMKSLIQLGHIAEWKVPTSDRVPAAFRFGDYICSPAPVDSVITYNINKVTPEEAKILGSSWKGVLDPRFKGRFTVAQLRGTAVYGAVHMFLDPKYAKVFGPEFIKAVASQKPTLYSEVIACVDRVIAGEHDFTYPSSEALAYIPWTKGAPIRWVHPDPAPVFASTWYGIPKHTPHPNAARLFINWVMSEEGALSYQKCGYPSCLGGVKDKRKVATEPWYDPIKTPYNVDWERWGREYNKAKDIWDKAMTEVR